MVCSVEAIPEIVRFLSFWLVLWGLKQYILLFVDSADAQERGVFENRAATHVYPVVKARFLEISSARMRV